MRAKLACGSPSGTSRIDDVSWLKITSPFAPHTSGLSDSTHIHTWRRSAIKIIDWAFETMRLPWPVMRSACESHACGMQLIAIRPRESKLQFRMYGHSKRESAGRGARAMSGDGVKLLFDMITPLNTIRVVEVIFFSFLESYVHLLNREQQTLQKVWSITFTQCAASSCTTFWSTRWEDWEHCLSQKLRVTDSITNAAANSFAPCTPIVADNVFLSRTKLVLSPCIRWQVKLLRTRSTWSMCASGPPRYEWRPVSKPICIMQIASCWQWTWDSETS